MRDRSEDGRLAEIAANLERVEARVQAACLSAGRGRAEVTVVAVTKTFPVEDVVRLHELGIRDVGENRDGDAAAKVAAVRSAGLTDLRWHFVGQVQRNKATSVATYADVVHSVDRVRLVSALSRGAVAAGRLVDCLVQVDLRDLPVDDGRGGASPADVLSVAAAIDAAEHLTLGGVMTVAPVSGDPSRAFHRLAEIASQLRTTYGRAAVISAGMSDDLEAAVAAGATHLRVGTALLGSRPALG
ncbi:MAG: YggS family pyridoxal phosphate-dependent enzyme [Sporichthyaceae bacterium]|nr:YggS family pyridoxal phosphate-dependent enzyme [Sporichthyaceae bacterium]